MSEYHRARAASTGPDLSGIRSQIHSLQSTNTQLSRELDQTRREYSGLYDNVRGLGHSIDACRADNRRLASSLRETQGAVSHLQVAQHALQRQQDTLATGLAAAHRDISSLHRAHETLSHDLQNVRSEQRRHAEHLELLDGQILTLGQGQQELRRDLERQRAETQRELKCLRDYQEFLQGEITGCQGAIQDLNHVTTDLQAQQNRTVEMVQEVNRYTGEVHQELRNFEGVVEDRHRQAQEDLRRQRLSVGAAKQVAESNRELIDQREAARFGLHVELSEVENLLRQAGTYAADHAMQNAALSLYVDASERAMSIRRKIQEAATRQIRREQTIRQHIRDAEAFVARWRGDEQVSFYERETLDALGEQAAALANQLQSLEGVQDWQSLTEEMTRLELRAQQLREEAKRCDEQRFPERVTRCEQRIRFVEAIYQGIVDTFARSGQAAEYKLPPQLADPQDVNSPIRFSAGTAARTVVVEIDLDGNCHFWWEGYPEKSHIQDVEEFESLIKKGRRLAYQLNSPRSFRGEPEFPEPPDFLPPKPIVLPPKDKKPHSTADVSAAPGKPIQVEHKR